MARPSSRAARASSTAPRPMSCRTRTGRSATAGRSPPGSIIPRSGPSMPISRTSAAPTMSARPTTRRSTPSSRWRGAKGIVCAFECCHALAHALKLAEERDDEPILLVNLSGRGDKDMAQAQHLLGDRRMSRYAAMFDRLRERGEGAFGAFLMLGDPDLETSARSARRAGRGRRRHGRARHSLLAIRSPTAR